MKYKTLLFFGFLFISGYCFSQQFTYKPINPAFGGETFNYQWMLSSATAQNGFTAPRNAAQQRSELEQFGDQLNSQILSQISRALLQQQIEGIGNLTEPGSYTFGDLAFEVFESPEGLVINILNTTNGEQTQIIVPN